MGRKPKQLPCTKLNKKQYNDLIQDLRDKIYSLVVNIETLNDKNGKLYDVGLAILKETRYNQGIVTLYLHALEQLGKLIMVYNCKDTFDGNYYDLESIKTDFYQHDVKLEKALKSLPTECQDIFRDKFEGKLKIQNRVKLLHSDINSSGNVILFDPIDSEKLKNACMRFKKSQFCY